METLFAGWDGGGTATTVTCIHADGGVAASGKCGALNLNGAEEQTVRKTVADCLSLMRGAGECAGLCVGAAGVSNPHAAQALRRMLKEEGYHGELCLAGDHEAALSGGVGPCGMALISGTGSICYGKNEQGQSARSGGYGHVLDDEGSGYAIGRDILKAVLLAADGRGPATSMSGEVARVIGSAEPSALVGYVHDTRRAKADIAAFAPLLDSAAEQGDEAALRIAQRAAESLCSLVEATEKKLGMPRAELAISGSILLHCRPVIRRVEALLAQRVPDIRLIAPRHDSAYGAAMIALTHWKEKQENG